VGGLYGVDTFGVFAAESMFYQVTGASKVAVVCLVEILKSMGRNWMDIQQLTQHMVWLGARGLDRPDFYRLLKASQQTKANIFPTIYPALRVSDFLKTLKKINHLKV
jgi:leucyl/phenylalanyl-tRNA--protein transferase